MGGGFTIWLVGGRHRQASPLHGPAASQPINHAEEPALPNVIEYGDAAAGSSTSYLLGVGQAAQGTLSTGADHDWYKVDLVAGKTYTFAMTGTGTNNVLDPYLRLYAPNGSTMVASANDGLQGNNSIFKFTATTSGTYFLDAGSNNNAYAGQYGVSITEGTRASFDVQMGAGVIDTDLAWTGTPGTGATITYAFRQNVGSTIAHDASGNPVTTGSQLTAAQQSAVTNALQMFGDVANLNFVQVNPGGYSDNATILFGNYAANDGAGAYAYYPGSTASYAYAGDVWLNTNHVSTTSLPPGSYSNFALIHEMGHAMGLSHPGVYNAGVGQTITYGANAQFAQDSNQYTVMSYFSGSNTTGATLPYADTLLMYDILALQNIYGADYTTRAGNTTYGFNSNAGGVYDFSSNRDPVLCIWDGSGDDTLDVSGFSAAQSISLVDGTFSNVGGYKGNVSVAVGAMIENAVGGSGADTIIGNLAANRLYGNVGNDTISSGAGADSLSGGAGSDWLLAEGNLMPNENAEAIARLYLAALGRPVDPSGEVHWTTMLDSGTAFSAIAAGIVSSDEFQARFGSLSTAQFVDHLYTDVLHRAPDAAGAAHWTAALNGGHSRSSVITNFSQSAEFITSSDSELNAGEIFRLYESAFGRQPDSNGFDHWMIHQDANVALSMIANAFVGSGEFQARYGALDNAGFVTQIYANALHRAPEAEGLAGWVAALDAGASRADVMLGISESAEHGNGSFAALNSFMEALRPDLNDIVEGGAGNDLMSGGDGADTYVFRASEGGIDHVYQFEVWDTVRLIGFNYANKANALSHMSQSGNDVMFSHLGETVTFHGATLAEMQKVDFLFA